MSTRSRRSLAGPWAFAGVVLKISILAASALLAQSGPSPIQAWKSVSGSQLLCIEGDRVLLPAEEATRAVGIEGRGPEVWTVRDRGQLKTWKLAQHLKTLRVGISGEVTEYSRLDSVPAECVLKPFPVGPTRDLPRERVLSIAKEIHERLLQDQAAGKAANGKSGAANPVMVDNREYLKHLIQEIGWIDIHRLGSEASGNAIVLAQHSQDLSLMMGILPFVEKGYKTLGEEDVVFAILYDRLQINLGRKQRYGTQSHVDSEGIPMVLPLEDPSKVEQFRKGIGLPPLAEYLKLASEGLYKGKPIRMPRPDE